MMPIRYERRRALLAKEQTEARKREAERKARVAAAIAEATRDNVDDLLAASPRFGELVSRIGSWGVRHFGVCWLGDRVLHIDSAGIDVVTMAKFEEWSPASAVIEAPEGTKERREILARGILVLRGDPAYHLTQGNCEQVARKVATGVAASAQPAIIATKGTEVLLRAIADQPERAAIAFLEGLVAIHKPYLDKDADGSD